MLSRLSNYWLLIQNIDQFDLRDNIGCHNIIQLTLFDQSSSASLKEFISSTDYEADE